MQHLASEQSASLDRPGLPASSTACPPSLGATRQPPAAAQPSTFRSESLSNSLGLEALQGLPEQARASEAGKFPSSASELDRAVPSAGTGHHKRPAENAQESTSQRPRRAHSAGAEYIDVTREYPARRLAAEVSCHTAALEDPSPFDQQKPQATVSHRVSEPHRRQPALHDRATGNFPSSLSPSPEGPSSQGLRGQQAGHDPSISAPVDPALASAGGRIIPLLSPSRAQGTQSHTLDSPFQLEASPHRPAPACRQAPLRKCNIPQAGHLQSSKAVGFGSAQALAMDLLNSMEQSPGHPDPGRIFLKGHLKPADAKGIMSGPSCPAPTPPPCPLSPPQASLPCSFAVVAAWLDCWPAFPFLPALQ